MSEFFLPLIFLFLILVSFSLILWRINTRKFISSGTVATAYDSWTQDKLLERLWGEHIHLGFYSPDQDNIDFRQAKVNFVHELVRWSGLVIPEVSLVAILDADKEGFLRSDRSLIQTIGRAARNINGKAILYADEITGSIKRTIDETERRREKQLKHNEVNKISPKGVVKSIPDIMEAESVNKKEKKYIDDDFAREYSGISPSIAMRKIKKLEKKMYEHASNLEFEEASKIRDEIKKVKEFIFSSNNQETAS